MERTAFLTFTPTVAERDAAGLPKRFEGVAYSGGVIPGYGWHGDAAIDLGSLALPDGQIFALVDHDPGKRAGKLTAQMSSQQILVAGEFFTASDAGKEVAALFAEGAPWQMSVGIQAKVESGDRRSRSGGCRGTTHEGREAGQACCRTVCGMDAAVEPTWARRIYAKHCFAPPSARNLRFRAGPRRGIYGVSSSTSGPRHDRAT